LGASPILHNPAGASPIPAPAPFPDLVGYKLLHGRNQTGAGKQYTCNKEGKSITVSKEFLEKHLGDFLIQIGTKVPPTEFGLKFMRGIVDEEEAKRMVQMFLYGNKEATKVRSHISQATPPLILGPTVVSLMVYLTYFMFGP